MSVSVVQGELAAGHRFSSASDVGLSREVGITFPGNGVAGPVQLGQAPLVTVPPQGSIIGAIPGAEKLPANSGVVGTVVKTGEAPWRRRNASQLKNQNVLSRPS